ncbi:MAG: cysteine desulfurase family protein [Rhodospirillaceae bacterium]
MAIPNQRKYLDYNATAPVRPEVIESISMALAITGNPSSIHQDGRLSKAIIEDARDQVGQMIGVAPSAVTFCSGATEANSTIILGLKYAGLVKEIFCSSIEHPSILELVPTRNHIPVHPTGELSLEALRETLSSINSPFLFCLMTANNETGVIQPTREAIDIVHYRGGLILCDSVQGPGKLSQNSLPIEADFLTFSAHKIGGPQGVGCFVSNVSQQLKPLIIGGGQERSMRAGTENVSGIAGFGTAAQLVNAQSNLMAIEDLRNRLEAKIREMRPDAVIFGEDRPRLPNTTCVALEGMSNERQIIKLDLSGYSVSAGAACSSGKVATSHVLKAMSVNESLAGSAIRISIGQNTAWSELEAFLNVWAEL